jgi:aryl-phospho-beta-D-glucosidase BglC (GH1 family)
MEIGEALDKKKACSKLSTAINNFGNNGQPITLNFVKPTNNEFEYNECI